MSSNKKQSLGRGLSALLENVNTDITSRDPGEAKVVGAVANMEIKQIEANPFQPRTTFEKEALAELVESIKELGIIQPVTVRKIGYDKYQLISGERRFRASQIAGFTQIPAYIRIANDQNMLEMALVENIQRQDLDPIEIAISFKRLIDECKLTQDNLGTRVGKQRSTVSNYLRLLKLPPEIQAALREGRITMGHAKAIVNLDTAESQIEIFQKILSQGLSVRAVEDIARWQNKKPESLTSTAKRYISLTVDETRVQEYLQEIFQAKVDFKRQVNGQGKIIITFTNDEELKRVLGVFELE